MATTLATCQQYEALLAVAEAIGAHRDLQSLLHDLAGRLQEIVQFDHVALVRHDAGNDQMHRYAFDHSGPVTAELPTTFAVADTPAGRVRQTQEPLILSSLA